MADLTMFEHVFDLPIPNGTVSPWLNNMSVTWLDTRNITYVAVIQNTNVHVASWDNKIDSPVHWETVRASVKQDEQPPQVTTIGYVHPNARNNPILVVGTVRCILLYDARKCQNAPLFQLSLDTALKLSMDIHLDIGPFCRGVTSNDNSILIGTHCGEIVVITCTGDTSFSCKKNLKEHTKPIADLATCKYDEITVSATTDGEIIIWQKPVRAVQSRISTKQPISVINVLRKQVIIGTLRGLIQFYAVSSGELMCEMNAHARAVTSISVAPESAYVLTASEDGFFLVSKLHTRKPQAYKVEFRYSKAVQNLSIVGAQFTNGRGSAVAIACYDQPFISTYRIIKRQQPTQPQQDA